MATPNYQSKVANFITNNIDLVAEYESSEAALPLEYCIDEIGVFYSALSKVNKAMDFNWCEAIKLWMPLTKSESPKKAAFAAYNIAVACEMSGNLALAKEWINFSLNKHKFQYAIDYSNSLKKLLAN